MLLNFHASLFFLYPLSRICEMCFDFAKMWLEQCNVGDGLPPAMWDLFSVIKIWLCCNLLQAWCSCEPVRIIGELRAWRSNNGVFRCQFYIFGCLPAIFERAASLFLDIFCSEKNANENIACSKEILVLWVTCFWEIGFLWHSRFQVYACCLLSGLPYCSCFVLWWFCE